MKQDQEYLASMYVGLIEHKPALSNLTAEEWLDFKDVVTKLEGATKSAFASTHFNWQCLMNNAIRDGQETHIHWHATPRYSKPIEFNGTTFNDARWPASCRPETPNIVDQNLLQAICGEVQKNLS